MSEVVVPKTAAMTEGGVAPHQASEQQSGKCPRTSPKKVSEVGESRVANLISVFSGRAQDEGAPFGGISARRSSAGEKSFQRREGNQSGTQDGSAEVSRSETEKGRSSPVKEKVQSTGDQQHSSLKDACHKTALPVSSNSTQVAKKETGSDNLPVEVVNHLSPLGRRKCSRLESNPFIQNDQKKLGEFGSPVKVGTGGFRRSQKNTSAVTHVEDTHEHSQDGSKDSAAATNGHQQQQQLESQQQPKQGLEPQRSVSSPSRGEPSYSQPIDFFTRSKASPSPESPRKVPMTPKVKGPVWTISLIPQQAATEPEAAPQGDPQSTEPSQPAPSPSNDQEDHVYDDVVVSVIHQTQNGKDSSSVIPVGTLPLALPKGEGRDSREEMCIVVPFSESSTPLSPPTTGDSTLQQSAACVELANGIETDLSASLQHEEQEDMNESFEALDPKEAMGSEEDVSKSPKSEKKFKWKLFGKKKKKKESTVEDEEQRKKKSAIKKRGSIPRTAIKLKPEEGLAGDSKVPTGGEQAELGEQAGTSDARSAESGRNSTSLIDVGGNSPLELSENASAAISVSVSSSEANQISTQAAGSATHLELRSGSYSGVGRSERKDKTISREIYDIIVNGLGTSKGSHLDNVHEQEEGGGGGQLAVPSITSAQNSPRGLSDESTSESEPDDPSKHDTRSEGSPIHESPSGELAPRRRNSTIENPDAVETTPLMYADALWDHVGIKPGELSFKVGNMIAILDMTDEVMWQGSVGERTGWFQASFVRLRIAQGEDEEGQSSQTKVPGDQIKADVAKPPAKDGMVRRALTIRRKDGSNSEPKKLSPLEVRAKVVEEILNTERDYVNHLRDIVEGYLQRCKEHSKLFTPEKIELIFGNIETIYKFQKDFLKELETRVNRDKMDESQIGDIFVGNASEFTIYSDYCNNHPHAVHEMNSLQSDDQYTFFFESCRLLQNLQDISLEGYLLTPVQKICKYPLQLSELLKYTSEDHPDHKSVKAAQEVMKGVAMLINEQKRRMENVGKIGQWQETIVDWKGEDILETSTELIYSGELHKISKGHSQERHFFLFDHQMIYCKKDAIGGKLTYKGRLSIDNCEIVDLQDGVVVYGGNAIKYAWKMSNKDKDKWYVVYAKSAVHKAEWMEAFQAERERVREDNEKRFHISLKMKKAAVALCNATAASRYRRKSFQKRNAITESVDGGPRKMIINANSKTKSGKKGAIIGSPVALKKSIS